MSFTTVSEEPIASILRLGRTDYIDFIYQIQCELCPTCQDWHGCGHRLGVVDARDIYDDTCDQETSAHWREALQDARGAIRQISRILGKDADYRSLFTSACKEAQRYISQGYTWETIHEVTYDPIYRIGMAYKFMDMRDPVYAEMKQLGLRD